MPPLTTGSAALHTQPGFREILGTRLGGREAHYTRLYRVETTTRSYEDFFPATGLPIATAKPQGVDIQSFDPKEGTSQRLTPTTTAIGVEFSEEVWEDDLSAGHPQGPPGGGSMLRDAAESMGDSLVEKVELDAHLPFSAQGFDGTSWPVRPDGSGFFATTHAPIPGAQGSAQQNRPTTDADFNVTSYRTAFHTIRRWKDDQNKRIPAFGRPVALHIPPEGAELASEVIKSRMRPDTTDNVDNFSPNVQVMPDDPYIVDPDSWFLRSPKHFALFLWRWRPRMDSFDDRRARVAVHVAYQRYSYGPVHWLGYYGSPGA